MPWAHVRCDWCNRAADTVNAAHNVLTHGWAFLRKGTGQHMLLALGVPLLQSRPSCLPGLRKAAPSAEAPHSRPRSLCTHICNSMSPCMNCFWTPRAESTTRTPAGRRKPFPQPPSHQRGPAAPWAAQKIPEKNRLPVIHLSRGCWLKVTMSTTHSVRSRRPRGPMLPSKALDPVEMCPAVEMHPACGPRERAQSTWEPHPDQAK